MHLKTHYFIAFLLIVGNSRAQIITDRPSQTESAYVVGVGDFQIESGFMLEYTDLDESSNRRILAPLNQFRYGLFKGVELRILNQWQSQKTGLESAQGIGDLEIGTKVSLYNSKNTKTKVSFISTLLLPSGKKELTNNVVGTINKLVVLHTWSNLSLGYNLVYSYLGKGQKNLFYSLVLGVPINDRASIFIEPYANYANLKTIDYSIDAGITYIVCTNGQVDFTFGTGLNNRTNFVTVGWSWLFQKKKSSEN